MIELKWVYELILIIFGLSLIGYFIDFIQSNQKVNKLSFWLLCAVWIIQTVFLCKQIILTKSFPITSITDSLFLYSWILVTFSLIINVFFSIHFIVFFTNVFSFFILLLHIVTKAQEVTMVDGLQLVNEILIAHITLAFIAYSFFTLSFLFSVMYLMQYYLLKEKKGLKWVWRLGDLEHLDSYSFLAITIGVPLLLIAIIFGIAWSQVSNALFYWVDLKTIGSFFVLAVYIVYLVLRLLKGYKGKAIARYNVIAFCLLLINFFLFSTLSNFHF